MKLKNYGLAMIVLALTVTNPGESFADPSNASISAIGPSLKMPPQCATCLESKSVRDSQETVNRAVEFMVLSACASENSVKQEESFWGGFNSCFCGAKTGAKETFSALYQSLRHPIDSTLNLAAFIRHFSTNMAMITDDLKSKFAAHPDLTFEQKRAVNCEAITKVALVGIPVLKATSLAMKGATRVAAAGKKATRVNAAHRVGKGELGKNGVTKASIGNYTWGQLRQKARILKTGKHSKASRRELMESGRVGYPADPSRPYRAGYPEPAVPMGNAVTAELARERMLQTLELPSNATRAQIDSAYVFRQTRMNHSIQTNAGGSPRYHYDDLKWNYERAFGTQAPPHGVHR